jgi:hypothetical protein
VDVLGDVDIAQLIGLSEDQHRAKMHRGVRAFQAQERQVQRRQTLSDHPRLPAAATRQAVTVFPTT